MQYIYNKVCNVVFHRYPPCVYRYLTCVLTDSLHVICFIEILHVAYRYVLVQTHRIRFNIGNVT